MSDPPGGAALSEFRTRRRVEFADTDLGGIVHFARFFVFMETAEHEFLEALGARVHFEYEGRAVGWPRIEASCRYASPVRLGDWLDIRLRVARKGKRSMAYSFSFRCEGRLIARGRVASVCCLLDEPAGLKAIPIPRFLAKRIAVDSSA